MLSALQQYKTFQGALEHSENINFLTFSLQTLEKFCSHKNPTLHSSHLATGTNEQKG